MRILLSLAFALAIVASAEYPGPCMTDEEAVTLATPAGTYYVANDMCQPECVYSVWIFQESNGIPGLQRSCEVCVDEGVWCPPDTIIF